MKQSIDTYRWKLDIIHVFEVNYSKKYKSEMYAWMMSGEKSFRTMIPMISILEMMVEKMTVISTIKQIQICNLRDTQCCKNEKKTDHFPVIG